MLFENEQMIVKYIENDSDDLHSFSIDIKDFDTPLINIKYDKKKLKIKESGLPQVVIDQTPKYMRLTKYPIVKAKVGPRIMTLVADKPVWDILPVKQEVKVELSGIYITAIKSVRGGKIPSAPKKQGFFARFRKNK